MEFYTDKSPWPLHSRPGQHTRCLVARRKKHFRRNWRKWRKHWPSKFPLLRGHFQRHNGRRYWRLDPVCTGAIWFWFVPEHRSHSCNLVSTQSKHSTRWRGRLGRILRSKFASYPPRLCSRHCLLYLDSLATCTFVPVFNLEKILIFGLRKNWKIFPRLIFSKMASFLF